MVRAWMMRAVFAMTLSVMLVTPGHAQAPWASLGPGWNGTPEQLGLSREWLRDGVILSHIGGGYLARTRDHGETWQRVLLPPDSVRDGILLRTLDGATGRITLVGRMFEGRGTQQGFRTTLYRSVDDGDHWEKVWVSAPADRPSLHASPAFDTDGTVFVNTGGALARSTDAGVTWEDVSQTWKSLVPGGRIGEVALSPAFATDRTIVVHLRRQVADPGTISPDQVRGLLISADAGSSWQLLGVPAVEGTLYPTVETVRFSPAYAEDDTLFAIASNEGIVARGTNPTRHLFRSTDGGQIWEAVKGPLPPDSFVALSPSFSTNRTTFDQDQVVLIATLLRAAGAERNGRCTIERSMDAGTNWSGPSVIETFDPKRYYVSTRGICDPLVVEQGPDGIVALSGQNLSTDLGQTWQTLAPPSPVKLGQGTPSPGFAKDGTIFFLTEKSGIWAYGSRTKAAAGQISCTIPLATEISRLYETLVSGNWRRAGRKSGGRPAHEPTRSVQSGCETRQNERTARCKTQCIG